MIRLANIPSLSHNQIAILFYLDMLRNELLIKKIHENFKEIFLLSYDQAMRKIRSIHNTLLMNKAIKYDGKGDP